MDRGKTLSATLIQETKDDVISIGEVYKGVCDAGMAPSTITIVSNDLAGYGDDYFNNDWVLLVLYNDNNHGVAPESEGKNITDYDSLTGTFTTDAFTANIEPSDIVMVAYTKHYQFATSAEILATSGTDNVQMDDRGVYSMAIYDVGNVVPVAAEISPGTYTIDRWRSGILTGIVAATPASKADGRIYTHEIFDAASGWAPGDIAQIVFKDGSITVTGVTTIFPRQYFFTRIGNIAAGGPTVVSGSIDDLHIAIATPLISLVAVTTPILIDSIIIDFTNWLVDANISGTGATLTLRVWIHDDVGSPKNIGNLDEIITEGISAGSMVQLNGLGTFQRNFLVTVQSSISPLGGVGSDLVKYHYASYDKS